MRTAESDTAAKVALKGLRLLDKILDELACIPRDDWSKTHVRDVSDCVQAAVKYQAEEREQLAFEDSSKLSPEDIRAALKEYLSALPQPEYQALIAEARGDAGVPSSAAHA